MEATYVNSASRGDQRLRRAGDWLKSLGVEQQSEFTSVAGDASFRRYFRLQADGESKILMDAPPPAEDIRSFIDVARRLRSANLHAPEIFHADTQNGYCLLEDLGDDLYRESLNELNAAHHFPGLFDILKSMALRVDDSQLPDYDAALLRSEMDLFPDWYLGHHRKKLSRGQIANAWDEFCDRIIESALAQPQCFVHRDFHSCNLLKINRTDTGIIDFQDAVRGPLSYDFISLIWDRYIEWPRSQLEIWMEEFRAMLGLDIEPGQWLRYCDLMGLQRNFKVVGIFARLYYRDGKTGYLEMIPRFYEYLTNTLRLYPEFSGILDMLEQPECAP